MKLYFLLFSLLFGKICFVQNSIAISSKLGLSRVYKTPKAQNYPSAYQAVLSAQTGLYYSNIYPSDFTISTGLEINQINGNQKERPQITNSNKFKLFDRSEPYTHDNYFLSYINLPIEVGWKFEKTILQVGIKAGYLFYSAINYNSNRVFIPGETASIPPKMIASDFSKFDFGVSLTFRYEIRPKLEVGTNLYVGLPDLYPDFSTYKTRVQQFTFGINYKFAQW